MTFRVGQKVVCVDDDFAGKNKSSPLPPFMPKLHGIYTIRSFVDARGKHFARLVEIINPFSEPLGCEPAFNLDRFRPIVERKTDISVFTRMLTGNRVDA